MRRPSVIVGIAIALLAVALWRLTQPPPSHDLRLTQVTFDAGVTTSPTVSADGTTIAYTSDRDTGGAPDLYVQRLPGGVPLRLTNGADASEPSFSPDGATLAYRAGGAIFSISASGGQPRQLAAAGRSPRYSPDGRRIVYWNPEGVFLVPAEGGAAVRFHPEIGAMRSPCWSPDGKWLMFSAGQGLQVAPVDGGGAEPVGLSSDRVDEFWWAADGLVFSRRLGFIRNLYRCPLDRHGKVSGASVQLTNGTELLGEASTSREGRIVFTSSRERYDVWAIPLDTATGKAAGEPSRLTSTFAPTANPDLSADGDKLLFGASINGYMQVWERDLITGQQRVAATGPEGASYGRFARPGARIVSVRPSGAAHDTYLDERKIATGIRPWAVAGDTVLMGETSIETLNVATRQRTILLQPPAGISISQASFSPDGRWLLFLATTPHSSRIHVAPVGGGEWLPISAEGVAAGHPRFSSDGQFVYFTQDEAIRAVHFDTHTGATAGDPFSIFESRGPRFSLNVNSAAQDLSPAPNKLVTIIRELTTNVWVGDLVRDR